LPEKRTRIWIDRFQTTLSLRIALYLVTYQIAVWCAVLSVRSICAWMEAVAGPAAAGYYLLFLAATVLGVGFLFFYDAVKYAHRMVGPLYRFRKAIKAIAAGEEVEALSLRKGDMLQEMKDEFNEMLKALEQRGAVVLKTPGAKRDQGRPVSV
jgi:sensor histidine kinase YesM